MAAQAATSKKETFWIVNIIGLILMFGFGKIVPPFGPVTEVGVAVIGVFLGVIFMSLFSDQMFYVSLLGMAALVYHGYLTGAGASSAFLGSTTVTQLIFVTALCAALRSTGAMDVLAKKLLTAKALKGKPQLFVTVFLLTGYLISMIVTFVPTCILMYAVLDSVCDVAGYSKEDSFRKHMLLGLYISCMGAYAVPFMGIQMTSIAMQRTVLEGYGIAFSEGTYFLTNLVVFVAFLVIYAALMRFVFRCDLEPLRTMDVTKSEKLQSTPDHISKEGWIYMAAFLFCIVYNLLCSVVPKSLPIYTPIFGFGSPWIWLLGVAVLTVVRVNGKRLMSGNDMLKNGVMWNLVCLVGMFSILGSAMTNEEIGIRVWLIEIIGPLFSNASLPILVIMVVVIVTIATNVVNGLPCVLATTAIVMPFVCQMALESGINPSVMGTLINVCANLAFLTYSGSVFASLILSREEITQKFIWTKGLATMVIFMVVASGIGIVLSYVL